jgi:type II secretory pathway pseudopilin PulG
MKQETPPDPRPEAGFTLIEALAAMVILTFGIMAVTNLMLIAGTSNSVANRSTSATLVATQQMETLKMLNWGAAVNGLPVPPAGTTLGDLDVDVANFSALVDAPNNGVADTPVRVRWTITGVDAWTVYIQVRAEAVGRLGGPRTRAEFTTFRTCTTGVAPCP